MSQWLEYTQLGILVQGEQEYLICSSRASKKLFMFKSMGQVISEESRVAIALRHRNIHAAFCEIASNLTIHVGFEYARHTLQELLYVHLPLQESHLRTIAHSVFQALQHIYSHGLIHGQVSIRAIRVCRDDGRVVLADCDACKTSADDTDLEDLGLALLDCMEGAPRSATAAHVREQRTMYKVFGLSAPERWSASKQLIDFIDDLFSTQRSVPVKQPNHPNIMGDDYGTFRATVTKQLEVFSRNQEKLSKGPRETESELRHKLEELDAKFDALTEAMRRKTHSLMDSINKMQGTVAGLQAAMEVHCRWSEKVKDGYVQEVREALGVAGT
nr:hypothetical protein B0A51_03358 [Rachicladosporium sp. CCFEE 5018]